MSKEMGKIKWTQVGLEARDCRLPRSKRGSGRLCGFVQTRKLFLGHPIEYLMDVNELNFALWQKD